MSHQGVARRRRALTLIAGGIAVVLVAFGVLTAQAMRASSAGEVARALEQELDLQARVGRTELAGLTLELVAHDVALDGKHGAVLRARELRVRPSLGALLRGRVDLRSLELRGAVLTLREADLSGLALVPQHGWPFATLTAPGSKLTWQSDALGTVVLERADVEAHASGKTLQLQLAAARGALTRAGVRHALAQVSVQGAIDPQRLRLARASLQSDGVRIAARDASFPAPLGSRASAQIELDAELARVAQLGLLRGLPALEGRVHAAGKIALSQRDVALDGRLRLEGARIAGRSLGERVELQLRGGADGLELSGAVPLAGADSGLTFAAAPRVDAAGLRLDALRVRAGASELRGNAVLGSDGALALSLAGDQVALPDLAPLLGPGLAGARLRGRGRVQLSANGPFSEPSPRIALQVDGFGVGDAELGKLDAALTVGGTAPAPRGGAMTGTQGGQVLQFERAVLQGATRTLTAEALRLTLQDGLAAASARVRIGQLPLADLYRLLGAERDPLLSRLQGSAQGSAEIEYARAGAEQVTVALELSEATLDGYRFDGGRLRARIATPDAARGLAAGTIALQELLLRASGGAVTLRGEVAHDGALDLQVAVERLPVARLPWMRQHVPALAGQLAGTGRLTGARAEPGAELDLTCDDVRFDGQALGRLRLRAELRRRGDVEARALAACSAGRQALASEALRGDGGWLLCGQGLDGRARIDLAIGGGAAAPVRGVVQLDRFDLAPLLPELRGGKHVRGELDASLRIADGSLASPAQMSGALSVRRLQLGQGDFALASAAPFEVAIARGAVDLAGVDLSAPKAKLALSAGGSLKQGVALGFAGKASADLLTPLLPGVRELFGDMDVSVKLALGDKPHLTGQAELHDGYVRLDSGMFLRKLGGKLVFDGDRVRVQDASTAFGGGVLRAGGTLQLRGARVASYELELGADRVAFEPQERFAVDLDASGHLRWAEGGPAPKLTGRVMLHRLVYGRHVQLPDAVIAFNKDERATLRGYDAARDRVLLDVEVQHEQPLVIRNNFLDAEVGVVGAERKLRITGSDQRLGLLGKLEVLRGRVLYRGDEFKITRGTIAFEDAQRIAPAFEVRAVAEKRKRPDAQILFWAHGNRTTFDLQVRCEASGAEPPPFTCDFRDNRLRCDSFDDLMRLWVCRPEAELSSAP